MSRDYFISDADEPRHLTEEDFPLHIGGKSQDGIVLADASDEQLSARLALSDGHVYLQPASDHAGVHLNDERLSESAWLKSGDRIQIGESLINWTVSGDKVQIDVTHVEAGQAAHPALKPPPDQPPGINNELPVRTRDKTASTSAKQGRRTIVLLVSVLLLAAVLLLLATPVIIRIQPAAQGLTMQGFPPPLHLGGSRLALPGRYRIKAEKNGYAPLDEQVEIRMGEDATFNYTLTELPGLLEFSTLPSQPANLLIDGTTPEFDPEGRAKISRGTHQLKIMVGRYLPHEQQIEIQGYGKTQTLEIKLQPAWANITISSQPRGAELRIDDSLIGQTPHTAELLHGPHQITLNLVGYKTALISNNVEAGQDRTLATVVLQVVDGRLELNSQPPNASISLDGVFKGSTPITLDVTANTPHQLKLSKAGYSTLEQTFTLKPDELRSLAPRLNAEYGTVFLSTYPQNAELRIDGKLSDVQSGRLRLSVRPHTLTLSKSGFVTRELMVTPRKGVSQNLEIWLTTPQQQVVAQKAASTPDTITTTAGQSLKLMRPDTRLSMGASRREAGRRANESRRLIQFKRPFYFASKEVSNREYRLFQPQHGSGTLDNADLNGDNQPVVNISWDDAARYCNWLSQQQKLPPSYQERDGKMLAVQPLTTGYRLPTEAEWSWVARRYQQNTEQRYPWAGRYPPVQKSGNYADARIADTLADVVPNYDDGYRGTADVGSFPARPAGFYDLGGNVAEWVHDYYALYPGEATRAVTDPGGPASGRHHVVRGAGWRHGSITELRLSYRDYSDKPRYDLGFRIARYAE